MNAANVKAGETLKFEFGLPDISDGSPSYGGWGENFRVKGHQLALMSVHGLPVQNKEATATFWSTLYVVANQLQKSASQSWRVCSHVRDLTGDLPLVTALHFLSSNKSLSTHQKVAIHQGLYRLFRKLVPHSECPDDVGFVCFMSCCAYSLDWHGIVFPERVCVLSELLGVHL